MSVNKFFAEYNANNMTRKKNEDNFQTPVDGHYWNHVYVLWINVFVHVQWNRARLEMFFWWFSVISIRFVGSFVSFLIKRHPSIIDFFDFHGVAISTNEYISFSTWLKLPQMLYIYFALYRVAVQHPPSTSFSYYYSFKRINHCASFWKHFVQSSMNVTMRIVGMNSTFIAIQFEIKLIVYCHRNKCSRFFCVEFQFETNDVSF